MSSIPLRSGSRIPSIGLGTYKSAGDDVVIAVQAALRSGIRHIDTAAIYRNEQLVAEGIAKSGVPRADIFITSKLSPYQQGYAKAAEGFQTMITNLGGAPVDLALIHWPGVSGEALTSSNNAKLRLETWRVLEDMHQQGLARAIGVSNFEVPHLEELLKEAKVAPAVNQVELHPRRPCTELRQYCAEHGIVVVAYSSLGTGDLLGHPEVLRLAAKTGRSPAQVLLSWGLSQGCAVIPKSVKPERIAEFAELLTQPLHLSQEDMAALNALEDGFKYCWNPEGVA